MDKISIGIETIKKSQMQFLELKIQYLEWSLRKGAQEHFLSRQRKESIEMIQSQEKRGKNE